MSDRPKPPGYSLVHESDRRAYDLLVDKMGEALALRTSEVRSDWAEMGDRNGWVKLAGGTMKRAVVRLTKTRIVTEGDPLGIERRSHRTFKLSNGEEYGRGGNFRGPQKIEAVSMREDFVEMAMCAVIEQCAAKRVNVQSTPWGRSLLKLKGDNE